MIPVHAFKDKDVAVFGLGASGIATAKALAAGGARLSVFDDNPESVAAARVAGLAAVDLRAIDWQATAALVLAPGVPLTHPKPHWSVELARGAGVEIIGDIELFVRARRAAAPDAPFVAITGTNGKSTTTALVSHILTEGGRDAQMGGNIGKAVLTLEPFAADRAYVVECSSYQIELAPSLDPTVGILLNLSPDHLDRHATMERYAAIKERLVAGSELAVVSVDDPHCAAIADRLAAAGRQVMRLSVKHPLREGYFAKGRTLVHAVDGVEEIVARLDDALFLRGEHNAQNALAAVAACRALGLGNGEIQRGLESFPGLAHRMQIVARQGHTLFVNDSKATNADAAAPALASFDRIYWIAGGLPKEGGIESLRRFFPRIARAYLIGEAAPAFAATLGDEVAFEISGTLDAAVAHASRDAGTAPSEGEAVVLLSPACASFDQFRNFEMRGEAFRRAVAALDGVQPIGGLAR